MLPENSTQNHINQLDGLRAIAIMLVLLVHGGMYYILNSVHGRSVWTDIVVNGRSGVDLFFVLSGFLITGILIDTSGRKDYFARFYWRRALRIWPLYYAFLAVALLIHPRPFSSLGVMPFALYYRNFLGADHASDIYFGQYWSLCVEEQFYLVWPLLIKLCPSRFRIWLTVFLIGLAFYLRVLLLGHGMDSYIVYRLPFCRMDSLAIGAAVAIAIRRGFKSSTMRRIFWLGVAIGLLSQLYVGRVESPGYGYRFNTVGITAYALFFGGIVGLCVTAERRTLPLAILSSRFLRAIATRSYAMYLFHLVPLYVSVVLLYRWGLEPQHKWSGLLAVAGIAAVAYGMAWISWRYFEAPILRLKQWEWYRKKTPPASDTPQAA